MKLMSSDRRAGLILRVTLIVVAIELALFAVLLIAVAATIRNINGVQFIMIVSHGNGVVIYLNGYDPVSLSSQGKRLPIDGRWQITSVRHFQDITFWRLSNNIKSGWQLWIPYYALAVVAILLSLCCGIGAALGKIHYAICGDRKRGHY